MLSATEEENYKAALLYHQQRPWKTLVFKIKIFLHGKYVFNDIPLPK